NIRENSMQLYLTISLTSWLELAPPQISGPTTVLSNGSAPGAARRHGNSRRLSPRAWKRNSGLRRATRCYAALLREAAMVAARSVRHHARRVAGVTHACQTAGRTPA